MELPTGTVTFLFTDVHDSTSLWERFPDEMGPAIARHDDLVRACVEHHGGVVVKSTGDGLMCAFAAAPDAVAAAVDAQRAVRAEPWAVPIAVRMGAHTGFAHAIANDYHAPAVNRAARVGAAAHPGQILVSAATASLSDGWSFRDLGRHALKGLPPMKLLQVEAAGLQQSFPPIVGATTTSARLPVPLTTFIGRSDEVAATCRLIAECRLVTLTGIGGSGKTRLALETARASEGQFADGAFFVDLAPVHDERGVVPAVAASIGLADEGGVDPLVRLAQYVAERTLLLVLDNCEHLLDACADLADALTERPGSSRILATSREPLGVDGERVVTVRSLPVETDAVQLFTERAALARARFTIDETNRAIIEEICLRLDGIPLAIELAAAQMAHLSVGQLLERLNDRFRVLVGGRRRVERQQTLVATLDWSHDMLTVAEQVTLRRLAVFPSTFTLDAAQAVVADVDALPQIASLTARSLVDVVDDDQEFRYRLLETVRMYAESKLVDAGEAETCRRRHRDWVLTWLESVPIEERWLGDVDVLGIEPRSVRAALEWSNAVGETTTLARIAAGVDWSRGASFGDGISWCERAARENVSPDLQVQLLTMLTVLRTISLSGDALGWAERALAVGDGQQGPILSIASSWHATLLAVQAVATDDPHIAEVARSAAWSSIVLADEQSPPWRAYCRFVIGMAHASLATGGFESYGRAEEIYATTVTDVPLDTPYLTLRAVLFEYLSLFRLLDGDASAALRLAEQAPIGDSYWPMFGPTRSVSRMLALAASGDPAGARQELHALHDVWRRSDVVRGDQSVCMYAGALAAIANDWDRASQLLAAGRTGLTRGAEAALVYYHYRRLARAALGSEHARATRDRGLALAISEALELALR